MEGGPEGHLHVDDDTEGQGFADADQDLMRELGRARCHPWNGAGAARLAADS